MPTSRTEGLGINVTMNDVALALLRNELPVPGTAMTPAPEPNLGDHLRYIDYLMGKKVEDMGSAIARALMAPGNALRGDYNYVEINSDGSVNPVSQLLMQDASELAGLVSLGSMPIARPSGSLGMGGRALPFSESLNTPPVPTPEIMRQFGRTERVPIANARATNSMQWDRFNAGDHPPELIQGYADKPVAVRKENGEYLIMDGHHRTALAADNGAEFMDMYVIDAKDYAPYAAGRPRSQNTISDDELLRLLGE